MIAIAVVIGEIGVPFDVYAGTLMNFKEIHCNKRETKREITKGAEDI